MKNKRILSIIMSVIMVLTILPFGAIFASAEEIPCEAYITLSDEMNGYSFYLSGLEIKATIDGETPEGSKLSWTTDSKLISLEEKENGCVVTTGIFNWGEAKVTATLVDMEGNPIKDNDGFTIEASQTVHARGLFLGRLIYAFVFSFNYFG